MHGTKYWLHDISEMLRNCTPAPPPRPCAPTWRMAYVTARGLLHVHVTARNIQ